MRSALARSGGCVCVMRSKRRRQVGAVARPACVAAVHALLKLGADVEAGAATGDVGCVLLKLGGDGEVPDPTPLRSGANMVVLDGQADVPAPGSEGCFVPPARA